MSLFFETVKIANNQIYNITQHNKRLNQTILENFSLKKNIDISEYIKLPQDNKLYRCKIIYDKEIQQINLYPYTPKKIESFKILVSDIDYRYKYVDRSSIDNLSNYKDSADDILITYNEQLRDTSIANIALKINGIWHTPKQPLLKGTLRAKLLEEKFLQESKLYIDDLSKIEEFAIMNAMIGFCCIKSPKFLV